jgi:hypothetical protein
MAASCFIAWSGVTSDLTAPLTTISVSAQTSLVTVGAGTGVSGANNKIRIIGWGYVLSATPAAMVTWELITSGTVAGTTTGSATIGTYNDIGPSSNESAGYHLTAEGTITATRLLSMNYDLSTFFKERFELGREPEVANGQYVRVRCTPSSGTVTGNAYIIWEA